MSRRAVLSLNGRNRAIVIAESLARVIAAIQIAGARRRYLPTTNMGERQSIAQKSGRAIDARNFRVGSWQNGFFADFNFRAAGFFRGFCRRIFSPHFCGEKVPRKILQENPRQILQNLYNKNPRQNSAEGSGQEIHSYEMAQMLQKPVFTLPGCQRMSVNTLLCDTLGRADSAIPPYCAL